MKVTIGFTYNDDKTDRFYSAESDITIDDFEGRNRLYILGRQFNTFLKQVGYERNRNYIFMEDVNKDELMALHKFLDAYRADRNPQGK